MDLKELTTFVAVADVGSVSGAAKHLFVTQPALSRRLSSLESQLGVKLFDRVGRRLVLTSPGTQLLKECRGLLSLARSVREHADALKLGGTGTLRVSASPHLIEGLFPDFLLDYARRYPQIEVRLFEVIGPRIFERLDSGDVHLAQAVARALSPQERRFGAHPLAPMQMLAASHPDVKLGSGGAVDISELAGRPLLQATDDFAIRRSFDSACRLAGFTPNYLLECRSPHALLAMAQAGHGIAIVPSALRVRHYELRLVPIVYRGKPLSEPLTLLYDKRRPLPPHAKAFCELLAEHAKRVFPLAGGVVRSRSSAARAAGSKTRAAA